MTAAGVSCGDILAGASVPPGSGKPGYVPGYDVTGTVEKVGASVAGLEVGQPVTGLLVGRRWSHRVANCLRLVIHPAGKISLTRGLDFGRPP
jgi:NADPH:quinone reductase-like Zn-dependent oxidoreductase